MEEYTTRELTIKVDNLEKDHERHKEKLSEIEILLDGKVDWEKFFWIVGTLTMIMTGLLGLIYAKQNDLGNRQNDTYGLVKEITGILQGAEVTNK